MNTTPEQKKSDVALREETTLEFWREQDIFKKSIETPAGKDPVGDFVFYAPVVGACVEICTHNSSFDHGSFTCSVTGSVRWLSYDDLLKRSPRECS